jgi:predicted nucleotidyltransferase
MKIADSSMQETLRFLVDDPELQFVVIFGSTVVGRQQPDSDIDVAVYPVRALDHRKRQQLIDAIALATGRPVDLIDLSTAGGALLRSILRTGKVLVCKNQAIPGILAERLLDWQEDFEPQLNRMLETRIRRFAPPIHGS